MQNLVQALVGWAHVVTTLAAVIVCLLYVRQSLWARVLAGSFLLQLLVSVFYQIMTIVLLSGSISRSNVAGLYGVASVVGLIASVAMVGGLAGAFSQIAGMRARQEEPPDVGEAEPPVDPS